ncbi:hypothetical protein CYMTET_34316 [Cymbomonas tetramitiformis]|uniref:Uncharacterized protein n=1 Tax=Cymbomonas tetramitiformis TaxID=36881 RepID=A0AAE0FBA8_9CHLO|nr:hypothetical protein CYMTET_34316 [Cymbomonas tetramitiformis]
MENKAVYGSFENDDWEPIAPGRERPQAVETKTTIKEVGVLHTLPKTITFSGSFVLLFNNVITAAVFDLPTVFQESGIVPTTIMLFGTCFASAVCATFLAEGISKTPGNTLFELDIVVTIVVTAQAWDSLFAFYLFEKTYAFRIIPSLETLSWSGDSCDSDGPCIPFGDDTGYLFTVGLPITVPAWLTEKNLDVSVTDVIWKSSISSFATYLVVGFLGALAFPGGSDNLLISLSALEDASIEVMSLAFGVIVFAFGIPVFAIIIRERRSIYAVNRMVWLFV